MLHSPVGCRERAKSALSDGCLNKLSKEFAQAQAAGFETAERVASDFNALSAMLVAAVGLVALLESFRRYIENK